MEDVKLGMQRGEIEALELQRNQQRRLANENEMRSKWKRNENALISREIGGRNRGAIASFSNRPISPEMRVNLTGQRRIIPPESQIISISKIPTV